MHSFESNGLTFNYNGDYSGTIIITYEDGTTASFTFVELWEQSWKSVPHRGVQDFVGRAAVNEAISRLEQIDPAEALKISWINTILVDMLRNLRDQ